MNKADVSSILLLVLGVINLTAAFLFSENRDLLFIISGVFLCTTYVLHILSDIQEDVKELKEDLNKR